MRKSARPLASTVRHWQLSSAPTTTRHGYVPLTEADEDIDASILTDHMMLQATELGLGTVWVCYFKPDVLREEFNLPANLEPINILVIGYSDEEPADTNRFDTQRIPMSQLVSYEARKEPPYPAQPLSQGCAFSSFRNMGVGFF